MSLILLMLKMMPALPVLGAGRCCAVRGLTGSRARYRTYCRARTTIGTVPSDQCISAHVLDLLSWCSQDVLVVLWRRSCFGF